MKPNEQSTVEAGLPWRYDKKNLAIVADIGGREVFIAAFHERSPHERAKLIVESVNNHDRLTEENRKLREALQAAVTAGEYVVKLCEATLQAGDSPSPTEKADWPGTCAHAYGAMSFLNDARAALNS